jgi:hypothetical protein
MLLSQVIAFVRAVWSFARYGDAPLTSYQRRRDICRECPDVQTTATGIFCGACDCPQWPVADLRTKWRMRDLRCPLHKW